MRKEVKLKEVIESILDLNYNLSYDERQELTNMISMYISRMNYTNKKDKINGIFEFIETIKNI